MNKPIVSFVNIRAQIVRYDVRSKHHSRDTCTLNTLVLATKEY